MKIISTNIGESKTILWHGKTVNDQIIAKNCRRDLLKKWGNQLIDYV